MNFNLFSISKLAQTAKAYRWLVEIAVSKGSRAMVKNHIGM